MMSDEFTHAFKKATTGKVTTGKATGKVRPGRKKELNLITTPDKDAGYVNIQKNNPFVKSGGAISIGYDFSSDYKELESDENDNCFKMFVKLAGSQGFTRTIFEKKYISKLWYNSTENLFGFYYTSSIIGVPDIDIKPQWGVCLKPTIKFSVLNFSNFFTDCGQITAEKSTTTDIGCNIPGEKFTPNAFVTKVREEKQFISPKKNRKVIKNDSENELSEDENNTKTTVNTKDIALKPLKEEKRKIEEKSSDDLFEKPPTKKIKKIEKEKTKQELSSSESEDISDTEIVTKHHVTRSKTKSARANLDLDKVVLSKYSIHITQRDISRLEPDEFLNDNIIDFYLRYIEDQFNGPKSKEVNNDFYIFNTHFYQLLKKDSSRAAERIARHVNLFEKKLIFIPVNENVHWSLIVICNPNGTSVKKEKLDLSKKYPADARMLMYCDSLGGAIPTNTTKRVREFLAKRYSFEKPNEKPVTFTADNFPVGKANLPKQDNHVDCGVFMIHYIQLLIRKKIENLPLDAPDLFHASDIPEKRESIKRELDFEISLNPQLTQFDQSFNSQSDSVMAISQLEDLDMKEAANEESNESNKEIVEGDRVELDEKESNNKDQTTQDSEDLFTEKVLECDAEQ